MKSDDEIIALVKRSQNIVKRVYEDDPRVTKATSSDSGIVRETDMVFKEVLKHLLRN